MTNTYKRFQRYISPFIFILLFCINLSFWLRGLSSNPIVNSLSILFISMLWLLFFFTQKSVVVKRVIIFNLLIFTVGLYSYQRFFDTETELTTFTIFSCIWLITLISLLELKKAERAKVIRWGFYVLVGAFWLVTFGLFFTYKTYGDLDKGFIFALMQTNPNESLEYFLDVLWNWQLIGYVSLFFGGFFFYLKVASKSYRSSRVPYVLLVISFLFLGILSQNESSFGGVKRAYGYVKEYQYELSQLQKVISERQLLNHQYSAVATDKGKLHIMVIGESLAKSHLSSYGYHVTTTPWIDTSDKIQFTNAYSNHTHTMESLSLALTQSNQYNGLPYYESVSLISLLNQAKFKTAWLSNQVPASEWDNLVSALAHESAYVRFINNNVGKSDRTSKLDKALIGELSQYLATIDKTQNHFIVLHMMGSHISYCDRVKGENIELPEDDLYTPSDKDLRCYDQTVKSTDNFLNQIYNLVSGEESFASLTFFSDHGEDVINGLGHDAKQFTETMSEIPFLIWTGKGLNNKTREQLMNNRHKIFTNDLIFDTMTGLIGIKNKVYQPEFDMSSEQYYLPEEIAATLHNKVLISRFSGQKK
ncbi:phosphoethanolamine transferase [Aliivibrio wodanis]|uniref:phosphoethanolamine transferase n=1 Tax=Aliivibrio wodanis TaxID=80852 RepID=UPI00406D3F1B